jgi:predicted XRE-type DNA-binding protein
VSHGHARPDSHRLPLVRTRGGGSTRKKAVTPNREILKERGYAQAKAAVLLGISQPKLSEMLRRQFLGFSGRKLMHCLTLLGRDVEILVRAATKRKRQGAVSVSFA